MSHYFMCIIFMMILMTISSMTNNEDIDCKLDGDCFIECNADNPCSNLQINCPVGYHCNVTCTEPKLCLHTFINAQYSSSLYLYANKVYMSGLSIIVPSESNPNSLVHTYIYSESNVNDIKHSLYDYIPLNLYAVHGFDGIQIISNHKNRMNPFLGTMYCTESYSKSCAFDGFGNDWSCSDKTHICNHYTQYSSRRLLNTNTEINGTTYPPQTTNYSPFSSISKTTEIEETEEKQKHNTFTQFLNNFTNNILYQIIGLLTIQMLCLLFCLLYYCHKTNRTKKQIRTLKTRMDQIIISSHSSITPITFPNTPNVSNGSSAPTTSTNSVIYPVEAIPTIRCVSNLNDAFRFTFSNPNIPNNTNNTNNTNDINKPWSPKTKNRTSLPPAPNTCTGIGGKSINQFVPQQQLQTQELSHKLATAMHNINKINNNIANINNGNISGSNSNDGDDENQENELSETNTVKKNNNETLWTDTEDTTDTTMNSMVKLNVHVSSKTSMFDSVLGEMVGLYIIDDAVKESDENTISIHDTQSDSYKL